MKLLTVAYYDLLKNIRDFKMAVILIMFPILSVYILGNAVGSFFVDEGFNKIPVGYINQDKGVIGTDFDKLFQHEKIKARLDVNQYTDTATALEAVDEGIIDVVIYLPENLSEEVLNGNQHSIYLYGKKNVEFVESMAISFTSSYNSLSSIISLSGTPTLPDDKESIERIFYTIDSTMPRMIDYYSVLTLLQMLVLGAILGVFIVAIKDDSDMHIRVESLPVSRWTMIFGQALGSISYLFAASIIVMIFTKYGYNANWSGNLLIILATLLVFCAITAGIGVLIGLTVTSSATALMVILLLMMIFGTLSGSVSPATTFESLSFLSPNFHAKILIFGAIYGYSSQVMLEAALWLGGFLILVYGASAIAIGRAKYDNL
ncbi:MAG: ABC transporter permease [Bacillota bacterium]|nr:ABC transporter permease [Bacillota bacterium]